MERRRYLSVGPAYDLPITGITSRGFTSAANTVYFRDERVGVPTTACSLRCCNSQTSNASATSSSLHRGRAAPTTSCATPAGASGTSRLRRAPAFIDGGDLFTHTNHYVAPELAPEDASASEGSRLRRPRAEELLGPGSRPAPTWSSSVSPS